MYISKRKSFDRANRKAKWKYQFSQQLQLQNLGEQHDTRDVWRSIGKLGLANDCKRDQAYKIRDDEGVVVTDIDKVLNKWKTDYYDLYNNI
jgi:hypothetical protein